MLIHYVGKTERGLRRPREHGYYLKRLNQKTLWLADLKASGEHYVIVVLSEHHSPKSVPEWVCWQNANRNPTALDESERWWIAYGRACAWPLTNLTNGGDGTSGHRAKRTLQMRATQSAKQMGVFPEHLKAWVDGAGSPERRSAQSARIKETWKDPALRRKQSEAHRGHKHTTEQKAKISAALTGENNPAKSPEARRKISAAKMGHTVSPETRRKISETKLARKNVVK